MGGEQPLPALELLVEILKRAAGPRPPFPPAEIFSEGWMLRLILDSYVEGLGGLPGVPADGAQWYSEARFASPFLPSRRGDPLGEGYSHVDGVVGQFQMREDTTAGFALTGHDALVLVEAKMGSRLAAGTSRVPWYDQAVRNVVAMAWTLNQSGFEATDFDSLEFLVVAPQRRFEVEPTFYQYTDKTSLASKLSRRVELYRDIDPERYHRLVEFETDVFVGLLELLRVRLWSWEEAVASIEDPSLRYSCDEFYQACLFHNGLGAI